MSRRHVKISTIEAVELAGDVVALAEALRLTKSAVYKWGEYPPVRRQRQIKALYKTPKTVKPTKETS